MVGRVFDDGFKWCVEKTYTMVKVVHNHQHNSGSLLALGRVQVDGVGFHFIFSRAKATHVNVSVGFQLIRELGSLEVRNMCVCVR